MITTLTTNGRATALRKLLPFVAVATALLLVVGFAYLSVIHKAEAAKPSDFGLHEGDTISAAGSNDPDVYIVNDAGFKRLFLNPIIFSFYGHLGGFAKVKTVTPSVRDAFPTSGLFRNCETNDPKVYGVETTGEDTGSLHWVNTTGAAAVAADPNFFQKVFCINNNEFNWYTSHGTTFGADYTSVSQVPNYSRGSTTSSGTPSPSTAGNLGVSLSTSNPAASTVTKNASGVTYLVFTVNGSGTLNQITLKRTGAGATGDFSNIYIYDGAKRLTSAKSFSSSNGQVTFSNLGIAISGTKDLSIVADMSGSSANAGDVNAIQLTDAQMSGGTVLSGLPVSGNNFTLSGSSSGTISVDKTGSLTNPNVGATQAEISQFKLTSATEAAKITRIQLLQGGTMATSAFSNIKITGGTQTWNGTIDSSGHLVFDMSSQGGSVIPKGNSTVYHVYADIGGKKDDTIIIYFELATDILAVGDQYGYGMAATITNLNSTSTATTLTLQGGILTLNQDSSLSAANIGTNTNDTVFLKYSMTAATAVEVRKTRIILCYDAGGTGTFSSNAANANGWNDIQDVKISDSSGNIIVGPADGGSYTSTATTACPNSANGARYDYSDVFTLNAGQTMNLKITGDIKTANTGSGLNLVSGDVIKILLGGYGDLAGSSGDLTVLKYSGTNTALKNTDVVPSGSISGPNMTIQSSSLTLGLSGSPISQTYVRGTQNVNAVGFTFQAAQASDLTVTDVKLSGYVKDTSGESYKLGIGAGDDSSMTVGGIVSGVKLIEAESGNVISATPNSNSLGTSTGTITFNGLQWKIPAGSTRTLLVRTNLSANATSGSSDFFSFDIATTSDVTALDNNSNTINPGTATPNGGTSPTRAITVANSGSVTAALSPASPNKKALFWGQTGEEISRFQFTSSNEAQFIQNLTVAAVPSKSANHGVSNTANTIKTVYLTYTNKAGQTLTKSQAITNGASANFGFTDMSGSGGVDERPYVPKDSSTDVSVKVDLKAKSDGLTNSQNNVWVGLDLDKSFNGSRTTGIKFIGEGSGVTTDGTSSTGTASFEVGSNDMRVYRVFPKFDLVSMPSPYNLVGTPDVLKFTVTAMGLPDSNVYFNNTAAASGSVKFFIVASGEYNQANSTSYEIYGVDDNTKYDSGNIKADANPSPHASLTFAFANKTLKIPGGSSKTFRVSITNPGTNYNKSSNTTGRSADYFQLILKDNENGLVNWVANDTGSTGDLDTTSVTSVLRNLPLNGPFFQR